MVLLVVVVPLRLTYLLVISLTWHTTVASALSRRSAPLSRGGARVRRAHSGFQVAGREPDDEPEAAHGRRVSALVPHGVVPHRVRPDDDGAPRGRPDEAPLWPDMGSSYGHAEPGGPLRALGLAPGFRQHPQSAYSGRAGWASPSAEASGWLPNIDDTQLFFYL